jgi:hypothetical protein
MPASDQRTARELCGKWMPRAQATCARGVGHGGDCKTPETMEKIRKYSAARRAAGLRESPELRKKHNRKYRITSYGITEAKFAQMLEAQDYACAMCHEPFEDGQRIHVDHDHTCCKQKNRACSKCVRGLLCFRCNIAIGYIEKYGALAGAYLRVARKARRPISAA